MRKVAAWVFLAVGLPFAALSSLTIPNEDIDAGNPPQVLWVDQNFDSVKVSINRLTDTVNALQAGTGGFSNLTALMPVYANAQKRLASGTFTGTGTQFVLAASPTLTTPAWTGTATGASLSLSGALTVPTFTTGGVHYTSSGGTLNEDPTALYWDAGNDRLGIGTNSPARRLHVSGSTGDQHLRFNAPTGSYPIMEFTENNSTTSGQYWQIYKAPTTHAFEIANPTARFSIAASGAVTVAGSLTVDTLISSKFYAEGSFIMTATGMTTSPTGTAYWVRVGKQVTLRLPSIFGTSNANTFTLTGLPANLQPSISFRQNFPLAWVDDATISSGDADITITNSSTLTLNLNGSSTGWTASGQKAIWYATITYFLQ